MEGLMFLSIMDLFFFCCLDMLTRGSFSFVIILRLLSEVGLLNEDRRIYTN